MSDFMKWLYIHYIKPEIDAAPWGEYELHLDLMRNEMAPHERRAFEKTVEFVALHAFQLGLRIGKGLSDSFTA